MNIIVSHILCFVVGAWFGILFMSLFLAGKSDDDATVQKETETPQKDVSRETVI